MNDLSLSLGLVKAERAFKANIKHEVPPKVKQERNAPAAVKLEGGGEAKDPIVID